MPTGYSDGRLLNQPVQPTSGMYNSAPAYSTPSLPQQSNPFYNTSSQMLPPTSAAMSTYGSSGQQGLKMDTQMGGYQAAQQAPSYASMGSAYSTSGSGIGSKNILIKNVCFVKKYLELLWILILGSP